MHLLSKIKLMCALTSLEFLICNHTFIFKELNIESVGVYTSILLVMVYVYDFWVYLKLFKLWFLWRKHKPKTSLISWTGNIYQGLRYLVNLEVATNLVKKKL